MFLKVVWVIFYKYIYQYIIFIYDIAFKEFQFVKGLPPNMALAILKGKFFQIIIFVGYPFLLTNIKKIFLGCHFII